MKRLGGAGLLALLSLVGACEKIGACKAGTVFLTIALDGNARSADSLLVQVLAGGTTRDKTFPHQSGAAGGTVQIDFPNGSYQEGQTVVVTVRARAASVDIGSDSDTIVLAAGCGTSRVAIGANPDGGGGGDGPNGCTAGGSCAPSSGADPCGVYTFDCSTGTAICQRSGFKPTGMGCPGGVCSASGTCVPCQAGGECTPVASPCKVGTLACSASGPSCAAGTSNRPDGSSCGTNRVCRTGSCVDCGANQACTPSAGNCVNGVTSCTSGAQVCQPMNPVRAGQSCGTNRVCNGGGTCIDCQQGSVCTPANTCRVGALDCSTGGAVCGETVQSLADGLFCETNRMCMTGSCAPAGSWITRGEDNRTFGGGYVYSFAYGGGTISPQTMDLVPFPPSSAGVTGKALAVMGSIPPEDPAANVYPGAGLAFSIGPNGGSTNVGAMGSGIQFQAKSPRSLALNIHALDIWTDDRFPNCTTTPTMDTVHACFQYPVAVCNLPAGDVWTTCRFSWSDFKRPIWGNRGNGLPVDSTVVTDIHFKPPVTPAGGTTQSYQFAIDDVAFVP